MEKCCGTWKTVNQIYKTQRPAKRSHARTCPFVCASCIRVETKRTNAEVENGDDQHVSTQPVRSGRQSLWLWFLCPVPKASLHHVWQVLLQCHLQSQACLHGLQHPRRVCQRGLQWWWGLYTGGQFSGFSQSEEERRCGGRLIGLKKESQSLDRRLLSSYNFKPDGCDSEEEFIQIYILPTNHYVQR